MKALLSGGSTGIGPGAGGLGAFLPLARQLQALFGFADGGEVLIETFAVLGREAASELFRLVADGVHDAAAEGEAAELTVDFVFRALEEELPEHLGGLPFTGNQGRPHSSTRGCVGLPSD